MLVTTHVSFEKNNAGPNTGYAFTCVGKDTQGGTRYCNLARIRCISVSGCTYPMSLNMCDVHVICNETVLR